jgi:branched-chain amino acid transport system substrate-binding protein
LHQHPRSNRRRRGAIRLVVAALALSTVACGNRLSTEEILAQNLASTPAHPSQPGTGATTSVVGSATGGVDSTTGGVPAGTAGDTSTGGATGGTGTGAGIGTGSAAGSGGATAGSAAAVGTPGETGPIVLGVVGTLSGPSGVLNAPMAQAVQAWAGHVNAQGGLFGRQVQVIKVDDGGDPARHVAALRDLVENRKVVAFVGDASQFANAAGRPYIESVGVPVIGPSCDVESVESSPLFFSQCPPFAQLVENIFRAQIKFGKGRKVAVIFCSEAEPCRNGARLAQERAPQVGLQIVYVAQTSLAQPDFTSECLNAKSRGADVIFTSTDPNSFIRIADACARQGYFPEYVAGPNTAENVREYRGLEKILVSTATFPWVGGQTAAAKEFERVFPDATGNPASSYASQGWVAAKMFELAANRAAAATRSINSKSIIAALRTFKGETLGGLSVPLTFRPEGGVINPSCYWAVKSNEKAWAPLNGPEPICG